MTTHSNGGKKGVIFSGMRPTGLLHLGNYIGALQNWVALQNEYDCIYCAVDIHALTTVESQEDAASIQSNIEDMILDWLAAGLDPERSIIFVQSHVPEVMTLHTLLSMVTPLGWLTRVPTFKEKVRQMDETEETVNYGLVGYPVLQTADIILYKADTVPVGRDQVPHIELSREIARRFNNFFGDTFPEPQAKLTESPLLVGLDGQAKMSKTLDNHLGLGRQPGGHRQAGDDRLHRPPAHHPQHTGPARSLQRLLDAPDVQPGRLLRRDIRRVRHRRPGLRGLQAPAGRQHQRIPGTLARAAPRVRVPARLCPRNSGGRRKTRPRHCRPNH